MYYAYSSYLAVINLVCILSSVVLLIQLWGTSPVWFRAFLILFLLLFTVIQPLLVWVRSKHSLSGNYPELELEFSEKGILITADNERQEKQWKQVFAVLKKPTIVIVYMEDGKGYILRNRVLGETKREFVAFARQKIRENRNMTIV